MEELNQRVGVKQLHGLRVVPVEDGEGDNEGGRDGEERDKSRANVPRHKTEILVSQV